MITQTVENIATQEEVFYQTGEFWVSVAFVFVVIFCFLPVSRLVKDLINKRIQYIKNELQDAENLKIDAQKLYADYERKYQDTDKEIAEIIANQQDVIKQTKEQKMHDLERSLKQKEQDTNAKIKYAYTQAKEEINAKVIERAINIVSNAISSKLTKKDHDNLINQSISNLQNTVLNSNKQ